MIPKPDHCSGCIGSCWPDKGFVPAHGSGENGVLIIAEAAGEHEMKEGIPLIGKAGHFFFSQLKRVGIEREGFRVHNCLSCRPPDNRLAKTEYEAAVIASCAPLLDETITSHTAVCSQVGKTPVIVTLGRIAFKRVMGYDDRHPVLKGDYLCYPFWSKEYGCWVIAADHPSYLMRGNTHLTQVLQFSVRRALEIAENGLTLREHQYCLDPAPGTFDQWVKDFIQVYEQNGTELSYDIETAYKKKVEAEDDLSTDEEGADHTILRVSFSYFDVDNHPVTASVRWEGSYKAGIETLFSHPGAKIGWNSCPTPDQKVLTADLRWKLAGDLEVGDLLVGVDENVPSGRKLRRFKTSKVTFVGRGTRNIFEVVFSDGSKVKVTGEHPWLVTQRHRTAGLRFKGGSEWIPTKHLKLGSKINKFFDTWEQGDDWENGYLAGFFDGEGHLSVDGHMRLGAAQNVGPTLNFVVELLHKRSLAHRSVRVTRPKDHKIRNLYLTDKYQVARFLGETRPQRLLSKFSPEHLGSVWATGSAKTLEVVEINNLGEQEFVKLSTNEHTYILEGFAAHNSIYDDPRVSKNLGLTVRSVDGMIAWHILNSALPKSLGFVTPFYVQDTEMWKHLSDTEPAFYNAKDAEMALLNYRGIKKDLERTDLWGVFDRYILRLDHALGYMSSKGVLLDQDARRDAELKLSEILDGIEEKMEAAVPKEARNQKILKKQPKDASEWETITQNYPVDYCGSCGLQKPKRWKKHGTLCSGVDTVSLQEPFQVWAKPLEFKISNKGMQTYQQVMRHQAVLSRRERKITFDEKAILQLIKRYPKDALYPQILEFRGVQKLLSTYVGVTDLDSGRVIGGMPVGVDGRIRTTFNHNPSTLRLASQDPNLQNLPRPSDKPDALANIVRLLVKAADGHVLLARDFSGIEAVLVGFEACDPGYIRLAKRDVHTFYTMYGLYELEGRFLASDLPELSWPDDRLFPYLAEMKKVVKHERNSLYKHLVHGANYMQSPKGAAEKIFSDTGVEYPVKLVANVMDVYFSLFKSIKQWHKNVMDQADRDGYVRNSFGFLHRFNKVYDWKKDCGQWVKSPGPDANKVIAFKPQSNAAGIIFDAIIRLYENRFEEAGQWMRLQVHDEVFCEVPNSEVDRVDAVLKEEMERPIECMRLPKSYGMGEFLRIETESKRGTRWGAMS